MLAEIAATQAAGKTVGGHFASPDLTDFPAYAAGGPADDHEGTRESDAIMRVRQGMRAMLRLGSAWYDVKAQITAVTEKGLDPRNFILCTDDCHSGTLVNDGHMDRVVRHAIDCGLDPLVALQMATINTATHFGMERELGSITPGRRADCILTSDLRTLPIETVIARGEVVAEAGRCLAALPGFDWPDFARRTVNLGRPLTAADFEIAAPAGANRVRARVIGVVENQAPTRALEAELAVEGGLVAMDAAADVCQIALVERHRGTGGVVNAFVAGFGYDVPCAVASTVAHDSHHMIVVGTSRADMALAANRLGEVGGGVTVWREGRELALVRLPIAGLMSDAPAEEVAAAAEGMVDGDGRLRLPAQQRLHAALAAGARGDPGAADLRPRADRRDPVRPDRPPDPGLTMQHHARSASCRWSRRRRSRDGIFTDAAAAVADLTARYAAATGFLRAQFAAGDGRRAARGPLPRLLPVGQPDDRELRQGRLRASPSATSPSPGVYETTITRPDLFEGYLTEQIGLLIQNHGMPVRIGTSDTPIPLHFAMGEDAHVEGSIVDTPAPAAARRLRRARPQHHRRPHRQRHRPAGAGRARGRSRPSPPSASTIRLARLAHYTATSPTHFQNHVLFTNYQFYMDEFVEYALGALADPALGLHRASSSPATPWSPARAAPARRPAGCRRCRPST